MDNAIIIIAFNDPDLIIKQVECINQFHRTAVDIIVIDNSTDQVKSESIRYHADRLKIIYKKTNSATTGSASMSHAFACNFAFDNFHYRYMLFLDHDLFPIKKFTIKRLLDTSPYGGLEQIRQGIKYLWGGFIILDNSQVNPDLVDFYPRNVDGVQLDTGGGFSELLKDGQCKLFDEVHVDNRYFSPRKGDYYAILGEVQFMHFIGGSNWMKRKDHAERQQSLYKILQEFQHLNK